MKTSATRLTKTAFKAALVAFKRVYQKLINKYEQTPTPSQPKKSCKKLSAETRETIKKVNNEIQQKKRGVRGSAPMYSEE